MGAIAEITLEIRTVRLRIPWASMVVLLIPPLSSQGSYIWIAVYQCNSLNVITVVMIVFVSPHYEVLLSFFNP